MSAPELIPYSDIESAGTAPRHHTRSRPAVSSVCFSDSDDDDNLSWHSTVDSASGGSSGIEGVSCPHTHRESCSASDCEVDLESGELERKVHFGKEERDCRICHLNLVAAGGDGDGGGAIELGCDCKGDLGAAHRQCAETWFKIKGNTTCEICGTTALNVAGEWTEEGNVTADSAAVASTNGGPIIGFSESPTYWQGRRIINIMFGCMVLAFVISWLLHYKVLPSS